MTEQQNTPDQPIPSQAEAAPNDAALANDALPSVEAQLLAAQAEAARAIWLTERDFSRRSAAWPTRCSEFFATPPDFERSIALVFGHR